MMSAPTQIHDPNRTTGTELHLRDTLILLGAMLREFYFRQFFTRRITNRGNSFE